MIGKIKEPSQQISLDAINMWRVSGIFANIFGFLFLGICLWLHHFFNWPDWVHVIIFIIMIILILTSVFDIGISPKYRQQNWRYEVDGKYIQLKYGRMIKTHVIIPMSQVQYVNTEQGPLAAKFGLSTINIGTMASTHEIPGIQKEKAIELRDQIAVLAGVEETNE